MEQLKLFDESVNKPKPHFYNLPKDTRPILPKKKPLLPRKQISGWFTKNSASYSGKSKYYQSQDWRLKRKLILYRDNNQCQDCGYQLSRCLEIHHLTYDRLYREQPDDLKTLCHQCHKKADRKRESTTGYSNAYDTYMTKKYGKRHEINHCGIEYQYEFDEWLREKEYYG